VEEKKLAEEVKEC